MSNTPDSTPPTVTEQMPARAAEFVQAGAAAGVVLDYLPRTLPIAEKFVKGAPAEAERMAAYLGEVIRRETKGFWFDSEGTPLVYVGVEPYVDAAAFVQALLAQERFDVAGIAVESSKAYCEQFLRLQKQWLDKAVLGNYDSIASLRTAMSPDAKTAGLVLGMMQSAVLTAQLDWTQTLDATADSLDVVEKILGATHELYARRDGRLTEEHITSLSNTMGIYVGDIIRRHYGGQWRMTPEGTFELPYTNSTIEPVLRARSRIFDGPSENIRMYFNSMAKVVAS